MRHTRSAHAAGALVRTTCAPRAPKGCRSAASCLKHALRNALIPVITLGALELGTLLSGAVLTEQVFTIPGFGKLIVDAVFNRDYAVVQGVVLFTRDRVHRAESGRRHRVRRRQPAHPRRTDGCRRRSAAHRRTLPRASPAPRACASPSIAPAVRRASGLPSSCSSSSLALLAPHRRAVRPARDELGARSASAPSGAHWFGTDEIGRDVLARVICGARASLLAGVVSVLISLSIGVPLGLLAGYAGGKVDMLISRLTDAVLACPFLILAIALAAFLGPSLTNAMIAIGVSATPVFVRLTRGQTLAVKAEEFILSARAIGNPPWRIALRHVLPNVMPGADRPGDAGDRRRGDRRGQPVVPGARAAAARAELGQHAEHGEELHR